MTKLEQKQAELIEWYQRNSVTVDTEQSKNLKSEIAGLKAQDLWLSKREEDKPTRAEEILENELNNVGFSFSEQLKPDNISLAETKKTKKAILKAMEQYRTEGLRDELIKYDKEIYYDVHTKETSEMIVDEYLKQKGLPL